MENEAEAAEALVDDCSTREEALQRAIQAAELYLKVSSCASSKLEETKFRHKCQLLLSKAESIKSSASWTPRPRTYLKLSAPSSQRVLTKREEIILLQSSKLHGSLFPQWTSDPDESAFGQNLDEPSLYQDPVDLKLSAQQIESFAGWKRPQQFVDEPYDSLARDVEVDTDARLSVDDVDLVQDITTDCSVVASLSAAIARTLKGHSKLLTSIIYPYNMTKEQPRLSKNGKCIFRMQFNGCPRQVVIDDRLPASQSSRTLHVVDRKNPRRLWPALIEKAYLKVRGGYDFPGSNSGTDLWVLTGWLPEQVFLRGDDLPSQKLWARIFKAFSFGDVMVTLGTGKLTKIEEEESGLAGEHDYAVLDLKQTENQQLMLVKNPWCDGMIWKLSESMAQGECHNGWPNDQDPTASQIPLPSATTGTFWMRFEDIVQNFENLYLNWNPGLFTFRQDHHFSWVTPQSTASMSKSFASNPQFIVKSLTSDVIWILLSRHFATDEQVIARKKRATLADSSSALGFISLYIFDVNGSVVFLGDNEAIQRGAYVDSPQTSAHLDLVPGKTYTVVVGQHGLPLPKYNYTLSFFSRTPLEVGPAVDRFLFCVTHTGSWTPPTAGGNASSLSYSTNPQFSLLIPSPTDLTIILETSSDFELAVNVKVVWGNGERITALTARDMVGSSGDYRRGCALAELKHVAAGTYTIVCSTFEAGQVGAFTLRVRSMVQCSVGTVLAETAGRLCAKLPVLRFKSGVDRMLAPLSVHRITRMKIVARSGERAGRKSRLRALLRILVESGQGPNKSILGISANGDFSDSPTGVRTNDLDVGVNGSYPGGLWVVVERLGGRGGGTIDEVDGEAEVEVEVEILSDVVVGAGPWGTGDG